MSTQRKYTKNCPIHGEYGADFEGEECPGCADQTKTKFEGFICTDCQIAAAENAVVLCAFHAAAPELLEAVKAFQNGFIDGSIKWTKPRQSDSDPYHPANVLACAAISKVEGRD